MGEGETVKPGEVQPTKVDGGDGSAGRNELQPGARYSGSFFCGNFNGICSRESEEGAKLGREMEELVPRSRASLQGAQQRGIRCRL